MNDEKQPLNPVPSETNSPAAALDEAERFLRYAETRLEEAGYECDGEHPVDRVFDDIVCALSHLRVAREWYIGRGSVSAAELLIVEGQRDRFREALTWYATVPRDDDGATMPLDCGERARQALAEIYGPGWNDQHNPSTIR